MGKGKMTTKAASRIQSYVDKNGTNENFKFCGLSSIVLSKSRLQICSKPHTGQNIGISIFNLKFVPENSQENCIILGDF